MTENRLRKYTMTAGTTIAVAAAGSAHAGIVSSVGPVTVAPNDRQTLFSDFGGGGIEVQNTAGQGSFNFRRLSVRGSDSELRVSFLNNNNVDAGMTISTAFSTANALTAFAESKTGGTKNPGPSPNNIDEGTNQLLAFVISYSAGDFFGWIDYTLDASGGVTNPYTFTVNAWAYNDVSNQGIIAGQDLAASGGGGAAVPGLGGLAALAIDAAGVRTRRQRIS